MYCKFCGAYVSGADRFCPNCGKETIQSHHAAHTHRQPKFQPEPKEKLVCELAYSGFGFWVPLFFGERTEETKRIANQGLWALILSVIACNTIRIFEYINLLLDGSLLFVLSSGIYGLLFIFFLGFMMYLCYACLMNVKAIHDGQNVRPILFFDVLRIIR